MDEVVGTQNLVFLRCPDRGPCAGEDTVRKASFAVKDFKPDLIYLQYFFEGSPRRVEDEALDYRGL
jgi:hypothetical protein